MTARYKPRSIEAAGGLDHWIDGLHAAGEIRYGAADFHFMRAMGMDITNMARAFAKISDPDPANWTRMSWSAMRDWWRRDDEMDRGKGYRNGDDDE